MTIAALARSVGRALQSQQVGTPVAARVVAYVTPDPDLLEPLLGELLELAGDWMECRLLQMHAEGGIHTGEITVLACFERGQTVLISCGVCGVPPYILEASLFGTQGVIVWEASEPVVAWQPTGRDHDKPDAAPPQAARHASPSRSLRSPWSADEHCPSPSSVASPEPPYGVLLVAGDHTHQPAYAAAFASDDRCRLIGVTDEPNVEPSRRELNQRLATRLQLPYLELDKALARPDVQVVSICAEPARRGRIISQAAEAGKHLYLDKPLCATLPEAAEIVSAVRSAGVISHMFSQVQGEPAQRTRRLVSSGRLGALVAVHSVLSFAKGHPNRVGPLTARHEDPAPGRFELAAAKRELTNIGVYHLVMLLWLLEARVQKVTASTGNYFFAEHQQHDFEDFGQILLELDGGVIASVTAGRTGWSSHPQAGLNRICLLGTRGATIVDADRPRAEVWSGETHWAAPPRDPADPMGMWQPLPDSPYRPAPKQSWFSDGDPPWLADVSYFLDCLQESRPSEVSVELAAAATEVLVAAYQSAASGETVMLQR